MAKRRYSDEERVNALAALAANRNNVSKTARELDIPEATLRSWLRQDRHPEALQMCEEKKPALADEAERAARLLLGDLFDDARRKNAPLRETATAFGILIDKVQLLRGLPTNINADVLTDDERVARLTALADAARARRDGHTTNGRSAGMPAS